MLSCKMVSNPKIDEPWLREAGEVPSALSFKEPFCELVIDIVQLFHLHVEADPMMPKTKIRWVDLIWRFILEVLHIWVTAEHLAHTDLSLEKYGIAGDRFVSRCQVRRHWKRNLLASR